MAADGRDSPLQVDRQVGAAGDAGLAHPARDERRVRGDAAVGGEDALRGDQPVDVVGARLPANEDHVLALWARASAVSASKTAWPTAAPGEAASPLATTSYDGARVERRVEKMVELGRVDPRNRVVAAQQSLLDHRDRRLHGRPRRCAWRTGSGGGTADPARP